MEGSLRAICKLHKAQTITRRLRIEPLGCRTRFQVVLLTSHLQQVTRSVLPLVLGVQPR